MMRVTDRVPPAYLAYSTPRPFPVGAFLDLLGESVIEQPLRVLLQPLLIVSVLMLGVLVTLDGHWLLWVGPVGIVAAKLARAITRVLRRVRDELALLRHGLTLQAHILRLRPYRDETGEIDGALLYCAIPVAMRRTYVGTVWLSDGSEALRIARAGRMTVIALPRTPGTWRIVDELRSAHVRYDIHEPAPELPVG
jgi:hypothetical protein